MMSSSALIELLRDLAAADIEIWLDGGWGVDALLGEQTRPHKDVDIIVSVSDLRRIGEVLRAKGFSVKSGGTHSNFVLADDSGREVDIHAVRFRESGDGLYRMANGQDWIYPAAGFQGRGTIGGVAVRCLSPEAQVLGHAHGYAPSGKDFDDMERLHAHFSVVLPPHLRRTVSSS
jgi:lincosamide nucleotidyltransferase A/C/D/E